MTNLTYTTEINAPVQKVWETMLNDSTYRIWTKAFHEGSHYKGDWSKGSKMLFLGPDENGTLGGMISIVEENIPYEFISLKSVGVVHENIEDTTSEEAKAWTGGYENYTFTEESDSTTLTVEMTGEIPSEYADMFNDMWPKGLAKLKELCEKQ